MRHLGVLLSPLRRHASPSQGVRIVVSCEACATDNTELWLSPFGKQRRNPCSEPLSLYQDLNTRHDWPVEKAIVDLPVSMKRNSKRTLGNSLSSFGAQKKGRCFADVSNRRSITPATQAISCDVSFMSLLFFEPHTQKPASLKSKRPSNLNP